MATVTYDPEADAPGILFAPGPSAGEKVSPGLILHFDAANRIVEIEILSASQRLAPVRLPGCRSPLPRNSRY